MQKYNLIEYSPFLMPFFKTVQTFFFLMKDAIFQRNRYIHVRMNYELTSVVLYQNYTALNCINLHFK